MKSFLQGKKTLEVESLRPPAALMNATAQRCSSPRPHATAATPNGASSNAHVEVVKEGDKVVRLVVTCACGEKVEIECLYSAGR
jgi:hypothetical protein